VIRLSINGLEVSVEKGTTILEAAKFLGFPIPTLCHLDGLSPYGACRLCSVEIGNGPDAKLVTACTHPVQEGMHVRTASARVLRARRMILELLLASCPQSKVIQDLASAHDVRQQRGVGGVLTASGGPVEEPPVEDPRQPYRRGGLVPELAELLQGGDESLLDQVLGTHRVALQAEGESVERADVRCDQGAEALSWRHGPIRRMRVYQTDGRRRGSYPRNASGG